MKLPKIHVTKNGKRYININGRKLYLEAGVTKKQILSVYKALQKTIKPKKPKILYIPASNRASAVIKQYINTRPITRRRRNA